MPIDCSIWPPNGKLVTVATISASVAAGSLASFAVTVTSNEPLGAGDVAIGGSGVQPRIVQVRADRLGNGNGRTYTITATATNSTGVVTTAAASCVVPHDQRSTGR
jgi:endo-1,4-beta-xylanase